VPDSEYGGFGFMPNPGVYSTYLCGLELAELGTHEHSGLICMWIWFTDGHLLPYTGKAKIHYSYKHATPHAGTGQDQPGDL